MALLCLLSIWAAPDETAAPFAARPHYVDSVYRGHVEETLKSYSHHMSDTTKTRENLEKMLTVGSAFWVDSASKIASLEPQAVTLDSVLSAADQANPKQLVVAVIHNLPNRGCHSSVAPGEICCRYAPDGTCAYTAMDATCTDGLDHYKGKFIDALAAALKRHAAVPVALVVEPESLANLATSTAEGKCAEPATQAAYVEGVRYALEAIARAAPHAALNLDAGHGGQLGMNPAVNKFVEIVSSLGAAVQTLRGFATNVARYRPLGIPCPATAFEAGSLELTPVPTFCEANRGHDCCADGCGSQSWGATASSGNNEHNFVQLLAARMRDSPFLRARLPSPHFIIDTSRNGNADASPTECDKWCNLHGAGVGLVPASRPQLPDLIDSYFWIKRPGESDGCTPTLPDGSKCPTFDQQCADDGSVGFREGEVFAPHAGELFVTHLIELACRARLNDHQSSHAMATPSDSCTSTAMAVAADAQTSEAKSPPVTPKAAHPEKAVAVAASATHAGGDYDADHTDDYDSDRATKTAQSGGRVAEPAQHGDGVAEPSQPCADCSTALQPPCPGCVTKSGSIPFVVGPIVAALAIFALWVFYPRLTRLRPKLRGEHGVLKRLADSVAACGRPDGRVGAAAGATRFWTTIWKGLQRARHGSGSDTESSSDDPEETPPPAPAPNIEYKVDERRRRKFSEDYGALALSRMSSIDELHTDDELVLKAKVGYDPTSPDNAV